MVIVLPTGSTIIFFSSATLLFVNKMPTKKVQENSPVPYILIKSSLLSLIRC